MLEKNKRNTEKFRILKSHKVPYGLALVYLHSLSSGNDDDVIVLAQNTEGPYSSI